MDSTAELGLIETFKRYGLVMVVLPALLVAASVGYVIHGVLVKDFGSVFSSGVMGLIEEAYDPASFTAGTESPAYQHFNKLISERIHAGLLTAIRLRANDGTIVYSTKQNEIGTRLPLDEAAQKALEGESVTSITRSDRLLETTAPQVEIVAPIRFSGSSEIAGVVEAYKPYTSISSAIQRVMITLLAIVLTGSVVTYTLLRLLVLRATTQIAQGQRQVSNLNGRLSDSLRDLEAHYVGTLQTLTAAVDAKDSYTARHSMNVADLAGALGRKVGMADMAENLERAGLLHDVGKIGVPEAALKKPGKLTQAEFDAIKEHPAIGATMIEGVPFLREIVPLVRSHHERWDGTGYPDRLAGTDIPAAARVLSVADAFDAMTTTRPYRAAMSVAEAKAELMMGRGTQFDPALVDAFIELIEDGDVRVKDAGAA